MYNRFWRWLRTGTLTMLVTQVRVIADAIDELDREVSVDSSIVRVYRHAAVARRASHRGRPGRAPDTASQMIMLSAGPGAETPPRSTSPATVTGDRVKRTKVGLRRLPDGYSRTSVDHLPCNTARTGNNAAIWV